MDTIACINCGLSYPDAGVSYRCSRCGGLFDYKTFPAFDPDLINHQAQGIWRYKSFLGLPHDSPQIYLGEGNTPLVWGNISDQPVAFKCEYQNPTGSFKDRGSALLISLLIQRGCREAVEDSSGNAGASFAAYAAKGGIEAKIFIPDSASGSKRKQIESYGAEIVSILGPRSNASEAVRKEADQGMAYGSHAYLPFNLPGYATIGYEIFEQLNAVPGTLVIPAGQGGLVLGVGRGFEALQKAGLVEKVPEIIAVQARACAPLWALFAYGSAGLGLVDEGETVAEGIRVRHPLRGDAVLRLLENHRGKVLSVEEDRIIKGRDQLAKQGFYVEATSAVIWDAIEQLSGKLSEPIVAILTGSGLKSTF
jgi:threonine synthase